MKLLDELTRLLLPGTTSGVAGAALLNDTWDDPQPFSWFVRVKMQGSPLVTIHGCVT